MSRKFDKNGKRPNAPKGNPMKTLKRIIDYIFKEYKFLFFIVLIMIFISSIVSVLGNLFLNGTKLLPTFISPSPTPLFVI